jgi:hypothetical protein
MGRRGGSTEKICVVLYRNLIYGDARISSMKKSDICIIIIVLLLVSGYSGCIKNNVDLTTKFIGSWSNSMISSGNEVWTFFVNGTMKNVQMQVEDGVEMTSISWFSYNVSNELLCLSSKDVSPDSYEYYSECFGYSFSNNDSSLTLTFEGTAFMEFIRI